MVSIFSTTEQERTSDEWFLSSGGEIRAFFEEDGRTVNKLGHALHDLDPVYDAFSRTPELAAVARASASTSRSSCSRCTCSRAPTSAVR